MPQPQALKVKEIVSFLARLNDPQLDPATKEALKRFRTMQALSFVLKSNEAEGMGTQTYSGTIVALQNLAATTSKADLETQGYYAGMQYLATVSPAFCIPLPTLGENQERTT